MSKSKINITLDKDLIEYAKIYAEEQRTSVSEIFTQFILSLKRVKEGDPTEVILSDPDFEKSLLETISRIRSGKVKWLSYREVF
ncbi:hypothetical protein ES705_01889 [subsurface metagenome]|nr:hypothetical protein [Clostridia bacterium]TET15788.1 MAG: hypothetical protein E3J77_01330 [Actinomycetota bacterium]